ncbi:hypothetical protein S7711_00916 [Stachybotrys chartarum IBT 7711]|uniref:DJ-1/PfpI domain-containing protein n=1 Tax=Stachybotrys chartarum (strain CBS 109288 / IBT 7711) TaxID=1280523 RepID=A0A084B0L5_STACB|nr:hypothetical protein S7711_00916 [Stachybotrys chartarum IBT 7711]KFA50179.1 hypothetical protein S40293_03716 [Stachybotrys chartarum IBT 40293]KFA73134.1 hypothetical protein S40288_07490 [Stachybotrys chartarum IBT 40288]
MDALIRVVSDVRTPEANQTNGGRLRYAYQFPKDEPIMASSILVSGREEWQKPIDSMTAIMSKHVRIGVFVPNMVQALDCVTVDVLGSMSKEYVGAVGIMPPHIIAMAPSTTISYITQPSTGDHIPLSSGLLIKTSNFYTDEEVAPGKLDIVVVPGPDPAAKIDEAGLQWLKAHFDTGKVDILSVCTGLYVCAAAGIADGRLASGPRDFQEDLRARYPKIKLVGGKQRWVQDGNFWSSGDGVLGGVTNGNDLMAAYARSGKYWPQELVELILALVDVGDREGSF